MFIIFLTVRLSRDGIQGLVPTPARKKEFLLWHNGISRVSIALGLQVQWVKDWGVASCNCSSDLIPGPELSMLQGGQKRKKIKIKRKEKKKKKNLFEWNMGKVILLLTLFLWL